MNRAKIRKLTTCEIFLDNIKISRTKTAKFLGVVIDENLSWASHIDYIKVKLQKNRNYKKNAILPTQLNADHTV